METFASGAQRSEKKPRFDLIPTVALERLAARLQLGSETYAEYQWQKGLPPEDTLNHVISHLLHWRDTWRATGQPPADDDLAAAMWGCMALMWFEANGKVEWGGMERKPAPSVVFHPGACYIRREQRGLSATDRVYYLCNRHGQLVLAGVAPPDVPLVYPTPIPSEWVEYD